VDTVGHAEVWFELLVLLATEDAVGFSSEDGPGRVVDEVSGSAFDRGVFNGFSDIGLGLAKDMADIRTQFGSWVGPEWVRKVH